MLARSFGTPLLLVPLLLAAAGAGWATAPAAQASFTMPESMPLLDGATGDPVTTEELLRRVAQSDVVLLGEVHDNQAGHLLRGALIRAFASQRPAIVFEHFAGSDMPLPPPEADERMEQWLEARGFDRKGWKWPLHEPVVAAAVTYAGSLWGSSLSREALQAVVRTGESAAPEPLRGLMAKAPMSSAEVVAMDTELVEGHCGKLPKSMIPGMRMAQAVRDAAMARALLLAHGQGGGRSAWLMAGNGHVRRDLGVPRILRLVAPDARVLAVGLLERENNGAMPATAERRVYDLVVVTPRAQREDPAGTCSLPVPIASPSDRYTLPSIRTWLLYDHVLARPEALRRQLLSAARRLSAAVNAGARH